MDVKMVLLAGRPPHGKEGSPQHAMVDLRLIWLTALPKADRVGADCWRVDARVPEGEGAVGSYERERPRQESCAIFTTERELQATDQGFGHGAGG